MREAAHGYKPADHAATEAARIEYRMAEDALKKARSVFPRKRTGEL